MKCKDKKMRYQLLVLLVCWLWNATSSKADGDFQCDCMIEYYDFLCTSEEHEQINVDSEKYYDIFKCNVSIMYKLFCEESYSTSTTAKPTMPEECKRITNGAHHRNSESEATPVSWTTNDPGQPLSNSGSSKSILVVVLGALVGLLLVLLVIVTSILVWTCWLLKERAGMKLNAEHQMSTDHGQLVNPTYESDDLLRLQPSGSLPAYETIPPHPKDGARLEFIEQGESGYSVLCREQRANPETTTTTRMEMILEDSREESYSKLELKEETGSTKKTSDEAIAEYSRLETVNIGSSVPKDTYLDNDATTNSDYDSSKQTERNERVMDNKAFDNNGDDLQLESSDVERGQQEEAKGKPLTITIAPDVQNERNDSNNTNSTDSA